MISTKYNIFNKTFSLTIQSDTKHRRKKQSIYIIGVDGMRLERNAQTLQEIAIVMIFSAGIESFYLNLKRQKYRNCL